MLCVAKSKLEIYEAVLRILSVEPLTLDIIAFEGNMDCMLLREKLDFLVEHDLVELVSCKGRTAYIITCRGAAIYKSLTLTKRLAKLQTNLETATHEIQPVHAFPAEAWKAKRKL
jgi:predicted transcriptional regulator